MATTSHGPNFISRFVHSIPETRSQALANNAT
jgi:hypothetical protein